MKLATTIFGLLFVAALGFGGGYVWHGDRETQALQAATSRADVCASALDSALTSTREAKRIAADVQRRHEEAMALATLVLDARAEQIEQLLAEAETRTRTIQKAAREDPACAALDRLALCPAIARGLWPAAHQGAGTADHAD